MRQMVSIIRKCMTARPTERIVCVLAQVDCFLLLVVVRLRCKKLQDKAVTLSSFRKQAILHPDRQFHSQFARDWQPAVVDIRFLQWFGYIHSVI